MDEIPYQKNYASLKELQLLTRLGSKLPDTIHCRYFPLFLLKLSMVAWWQGGELELTEQVGLNNILLVPGHFWKLL